MKLGGSTRTFVLHWGELGGRWGISRTVAQIHALLLASDRPLPADEIAEALEVARSNVSTSLRELVGWRLARVVHLPGDRRDHFETLSDVWEMFRIVAEERRRREIDPTVERLREVVADARREGSAGARVAARAGDLLEFFELSGAALDQLAALPPPMLRRLCTAARKIPGWLRGVSQ